MKYFLSLSLLLLIFAGCQKGTKVTTSPETLEQREAQEIFIVGFKAGFGSETYYRLKDGIAYSNRYADLRSNDPENKLDRDNLAANDENWVADKRPGLAKELMTLYGDFPAAAFQKITDTNNCAALAYDGGCAYVGIYDKYSGTYKDWFGDFADAPQVSAYMQRVKDLVNAY